MAAADAGMAASDAGMAASDAGMAASDAGPAHVERSASAFSGHSEPLTIHCDDLPSVRAEVCRIHDNS